MKGKISTGIWFIFFGLIALLHNFDVINFNFWAILPYWPLLVIALGANLVFQNKKNGTFVLTIINIVLCLFLSYIGMTSNSRADFLNNISISNSTDSTGSSSTVSVALDTAVQDAKLIINAGAISLKMDSVGTKDLIYASSENSNTGLKLSKTGDLSQPILELNTVVKKENSKNNKVSLQLNNSPIWDLELNIGAAAFSADFSNHKFSKMEINAGAASMNLTLGMPSQTTSLIEINTAASSCKIEIPKDAACRVETSTLLSSRKLDGFEKNGDYLQTPNYDTADKKYSITIDGAANSLKINRY